MSSGDAGSDSAGKLWGGRFTAPTADALAALSRSTHFDIALLPYDIAQSRAHARELHRCGYLDDAQAVTLDDALAQIAHEFAAGTWAPSAADEDVHSAVERTLIERCGADIGGRIRQHSSSSFQCGVQVMP